MYTTDSFVTLIDKVDANAVLRKIEYAARTCYQSYDKMTPDSAVELIRRAIARGHESVLEHVQISFKVVCSRDVLAQWTRHRLASYSVESQRYCNYTKDKYDFGVGFIMPMNVTYEMAEKIEEAYAAAETAYKELIAMGAKPEQARAVLPNGAKTEFVWSANIREIRHFIALRTSAGAQPDIKKLAQDVIEILCALGLEVLIEDLIGESATYEKSY